ncbi:MAG: extracellular solute-binding protein [Defluviitaleaceae bacterium]|nr:extracellular solute-binding protein [Defluviitaleaceae bacterium]
MKKILKSLSFVILLIAMAFVVTGCGGNDNGGTTTPGGGTPAPGGAEGVTTPGGDTPAFEGEVINLSMGWWGSQGRHDITEEVIQMWNRENPGIQVTGYPLAFDGYFMSLATRVASETVWDVFQLGSNYPEFINSIVPLNDFINQGVIDVSNTTQDFIDITTTHREGFEGNIVGISNGVNAWGFAYDGTVFDAAGVPRPTIGWTWDEFEHAVLTIHDQLGIWGMGAIDNDFIMLSQFMLQMGVDFYHTDPAQLGFNDPSVMERYFEIRQNMVVSGAMPDPGEAMLITDVEGDPLVFGQSAMAYLASNQFIQLARAAQAHDEAEGNPHRDLGMVIMPTIPGTGIPTDIVNSQMMSVSTSSAHPEAAAQFLDFWVNSVEANMILQGERGVPIMEHVRTAIAPYASPEQAAVNLFVNQVQEMSDVEAGDVLNNPRQGEIEGYLNNVLIDQLSFEMITPAQAAQRLYDFAIATVTR